MRESDKTHDDGEKTRYDLLPMESLDAVAQVLTYGAKKYADDSWKQTPEALDRYYASTLRHLSAWRQGELLDTESHLPPLWHAATNLLFMIWHSKKGTV